MVSEGRIVACPIKPKVVNPCLSRYDPVEKRGLF